MFVRIDKEEKALTMDSKVMDVPLWQCSVTQVIISFGFLIRTAITFIPLPSYSPHLAPMDFFLFPKLKSI
jgi:hypothetical protein